eukprot:4157975-Pleurochrysis_carterae.AAC.5
MPQDLRRNYLAKPVAAATTGKPPGATGQAEALNGVSAPPLARSSFHLHGSRFPLKEARVLY